MSRAAKLDADAPSDAERIAAVAAASRAGMEARGAWASWDHTRQGLEPGAGAAHAQLGAELAAAARLSDSSGAPLADVLDALVTLERSRESVRRSLDVAAAGPEASARVLGWLPALGLGLGAVVEPRVLGILFGTKAGWVLLILSAGLTVVGRVWSARLVAGARRAGEVP